MSEEHPQSAGALENNDKLGRDDPVWPLYVEEATSWDAALVREWNQNMDVLLLFAALFSAIVTAFVIESSKSLQEDNAAATVLKLVEISETLQLIALGARPNVTSPSAAEPFQPTKNAVLVNKLWFISLSLSITVSLVAILVKQWCNGLTSESFTSPCQQARTRQARYQALIDWHTRDIVEFLPIIMHSALGLFLWGLIYFLKDLCSPVSLAVKAVAIATLVFYGATTILPLFIPFCPYNTPLSSLRLWGSIYSWCAKLLELLFSSPTADSPQPQIWRRILTRIRRAEIDVSTRTTPDKYTGHALKWLIKHSRNTPSREQAIQAIAGLESQETIQPFLEEGQILLQVAQSFTCCFIEAPGNGGLDSSLKRIKEIETVARHGHALTVLTSYLNDTLDPLLMDAQLAQFDDRTLQAVEDRFYFQAHDPTSDNASSAFGAVGLSVWYDFVRTKHETRFRGGELLLRMCELLRTGNSLLPLDKLIIASSTEAAYWEQGIVGISRRRLLKQLLSLLAGIEFQAIRPGIAHIFAVLALAMQNYPQESTVEESLAERRKRRAKEAAHYYSKQNHINDSEVNALLLFGLSGMLEHYEVHGLTEEDMDHVSVIAEQLKGLHILDGNRPIRITTILPPSFDVRAYTVDILVHYLHRPVTSGKVRLSDDACITLLEVVSHRTYIWLKHSVQLMLPIGKLLQETGPPALHRQCLVAMAEFWHTAPSHPDLQVLLDHDFHYRLVVFMDQDDDIILRSHAVTHFNSLTSYLQRPEWGTTVGDGGVAPQLMKRTIRENLFGAFCTMFLHQTDKASRSNRNFWEGHIRDLASSNSMVAESLRTFFRGNLGLAGWVAKLGPILFPDPEELKKEKTQGYSGFLRPHDGPVTPSSSSITTNKGTQSDHPSGTHSQEPYE